MNGYSIIVPCHNERDSVVGILKKMVDLMSEQSYEFEIIVVDDASTDGSGDILKKCGLPINLIHNEFCLGYGGSLKKGIRKSQYDYIVVIDADGTYPVDVIPELIRDAVDSDYDMVVGARVKKKSKIPLIRRPAKWFITKLATYLSERAIPDLNSGLRIIRKEVLEKYFNILPDGFSFTTTITLAMLTNGYAVNYIPIDYYQRKGKSKIHPMRDTINFTFLVVKTVMYFRPLKVFLPMSMICFSCGIILSLYRIFFIKTLTVTIVTLFAAAFQILAIGMLAELINERMNR